MLEIVFSDSACGSLKLARHFGEGEYSGGGIGVLLAHSDGSEPTQAEKDEALCRAEEQARREWEEAQPLGDALGEVLCFPLGLSMGDISEAVPGPLRLPVLRMGYVFAVPEMEAEIAALIAQTRASLSALLERSAEGEEVRVWYSDAPEELCGFYWLMSHLETLKDRCGPVQGLKLPRYTEKAKTLVSCGGWGEVAPGEFSRYLSLDQPVSPLLRRACARQWQQLQQENAPLRGALNGRLVSLPADAYDSFIRREISKMEPVFDEPQAIGQILARELGIGDALIAERIESMVRSGELEALTQPPADGARYRRRLRRTERFRATAK